MSAHERERLAGYLDGELGPAERAEVEAHLATCEACTSLLAQMGAVDDIVRRLPHEAPSGYFEALPGRVRTRIEAEGPSRTRVVPARARWRLPVWTWAAAAALLLAVVTPLTLPRLYRARVATREMPAAATPAGEATTQAPPPAPVGLAPTPTDDERAPGPSPKREAGRDRRMEERAPEPEPAFAAPPPATGAPLAVQRGRLDRADVADAPPPPVEDRSAELEKDAPALGGVAPAVVAEGESFEEALSTETDRDRRQAAMVGARASPAAPATPAEASAPMPAAPTTQSVEAPREGPALAEKKAVLQDDAVEFRRLTGDLPADAAGWRERRETWRAFVARHPRSRHVDEARVRVIEAGLEAWRAGGDPEDLVRARADAGAYLARDDARLKPRVRRALEAVESH